jgi:archaellin
MIEIKTTINKDLNEIIFFEELFGFRNSEWSKERRSEYSKYFKSENIKKYRNNFLNVFNEIPDGLIESIFALPKKERYEILKKEFGEEKSKQIKNLLKDLSKNFSYVFNKVWEDKEKKLKILKKILYTNTENVHKSLSEINSLLEIKNSKKIEVEVCLIFGSNFNNDINAYFSKFKNKRTVFVDGYFVDKKNKNFSSLLVVLISSLFINF